MSLRRLTTVIAFACSLVAAALGWSLWWQQRRMIQGEDFTRQRVKYLESETQRLRDSLAGKEQQAEAADTSILRKQIEGEVATLRGLSFLSPVAYRQIPRADLPAILRQKLAQQIPDQEFSQTSVALAALGLIPHGLDLKKTYLGLLSEQVGAFYDQHNRELFTFTGQPLAQTQNQVVLAHELTHALEDQHFHLERLPLEAKGNDDRSLAASALVEGDATLVMNQYMVNHLTTASVRESLAATMTTDLRQLAAAPRYLRESLLFPYLRGQEFCQALFAHGGWDELAEAFAHPPESSSQILHPERYLAEPREKLVPVNFASETILDTAPIVSNVLGEFGLGQWLKRWLKDDKLASNLAAGWNGDRYLAYGNADQSSYVWKIDWRESGLAEAFATAAAAALSEKGDELLEENAVTGGRPIHYFQKAWRHGNQYFFIVADDNRRSTVLIDAHDAPWYEAAKVGFAKDFATAGSKSSNAP